jgi:hypothetical protein
VRGPFRTAWPGRFQAAVGHDRPRTAAGPTGGAVGHRTYRVRPRKGKTAHRAPVPPQGYTRPSNLLQDLILYNTYTCARSFMRALENACMEATAMNKKVSYRLARKDTNTRCMHLVFGAHAHNLAHLRAYMFTKGAKVARGTKRFSARPRPPARHAA